MTIVSVHAVVVRGACTALHRLGLGVLGLGSGFALSPVFAFVSLQHYNTELIWQRRPTLPCNFLGRRWIGGGYVNHCWV